MFLRQFLFYFKPVNESTQFIGWAKLIEFFEVFFCFCNILAFAVQVIVAETAVYACIDILALLKV